MVDERKSVRDSLFKIVSNLSSSFADEQSDADDGDDDHSGRGGLDASTARALISAVFQRAGKSKDDVIQIIAREIGVAIAAMLKEPLSQLAKHQKLQISFEFVPKSLKHSREKEASFHEDDGVNETEKGASWPSRERHGAPHKTRKAKTRTAKHPTKRSSSRKKPAIRD